MNKVCVYAICKNEAKFVKKWYESMKEADYIVVLDTGSTDNTVELLKEVGVDRVEIHKYGGDDIFRFDDARNRALALAPEDANILVSTDLDELFDPGWCEPLREKWDDDLYERAEYSYIWRHFADGKPDVTFRYNKIHNRDWIWRTPVHEYLTRKENENNFYYNRKNALNLEGKIILHHYPDNTKSRGSYLPLLEIRAKDYPDDTESLVYLAREYWFYNRYEDCIKVFEKVVTEYKDKFDSIHLAYAYLLIGICYDTMCLNTVGNDEKLAEEYYQKGIEAHNKGIEVKKDFMENYTAIADVCIRYKKDNEFCKDIIIKGFKVSKRMNHWLEAGSNWTYIPLGLLSVACYKLGEYRDALAYAAKALSYCPGDEGLKHNYDLCVEASIEKLMS